MAWRARLALPAIRLAGLASGLVAGDSQAVQGERRSYGIPRLLAVLAVLLESPAPGQMAGADGDFAVDFPTAPPASYVLDDADLFRHDTETLQSISARLAGFDARHGMPIYLAVYAGLIGTTPAERAVELHNAWLGDRYGFVLVFDSDSGDLELGRPFETDRSESLIPPLAAGTGRIPSYELLEIKLRVNERIKPDEDKVARIDNLTREILLEFEACLARLEAPASKVDGLRFGLIVVGMIAAIGLVALVAVRVLSHAEQQAGRSHRFPEVLVGQRLGAPWGGGRVSSKLFRDQARNGSARANAAGGGGG